MPSQTSGVGRDGVPTLGTTTLPSGSSVCGQEGAHLTLLSAKFAPRRAQPHWALQEPVLLPSGELWGAHITQASS